MRTAIITGLLLFGRMALAQQTEDTIRLSLNEVVEMAKQGSIAARQAATLKETRYWEWRTYRSNYAPQLQLQGTLPGFQRTFYQVLQPNGTVLFQPVYNNNSMLNLSFSQGITATGGTIYGATELQRFDDFDRNTTLYNAVPYTIGYNQPIFGFNKLKWDNKVEPLKYRESEQQFISDMEYVAVNATTYYFDLLLAQVNYQVAETNLQNTKRMQAIADEKFSLGKIARNEMLQLQLEALKAEKSLGSARRDMEMAMLNLRSYTGLQQKGKIVLELPPSEINVVIPTEKVLSEAMENNADAIAFVRKVVEAERDVAMAKGANGLTASLTANLGFSNSATSFSKLYNAPRNQQLVQLQFTVPILDWGRSRSRAKTAAANLKLTKYEVEQDKQNFSQLIATKVTLFEMMKEQVVLSAMADSIASEKYLIANNRYALGNMSITDLSIAFQEKDQAKRDYITAMANFWGVYYELRFLSLYDFSKQEKISYPSLNTHR